MFIGRGTQGIWQLRAMFALQQRLLAFKPPAITGQSAVAAQHAVTRNCHCQRIGGAGVGEGGGPGGFVGEVETGENAGVAERGEQQLAVETAVAGAEAAVAEEALEARGDGAVERLQAIGTL